MLNNEHCENCLSRKSNSHNGWNELGNENYGCNELVNISRVNIRALVVWNDLWYSFFSHPYFYFGESRDKWIFEKSSLRRWVIWRFMRKFKKKLGQRWNSKGSLGYILEEYWGIYPWSYSWRSSGVQNIMFDTTLNLQD